MTMRRPAKSWHTLSWLLLAGQIGYAQGAENAPDLQSPDLALLEFLGSFETDNGEWIEPESLLTGEFAELLNLAAEMDAATGADNPAAENSLDDLDSVDSVDSGNNQSNDQ